VTAAAADPTRTVVVPPLAAAAGAPASLVIALADSFGNIVDEDLTAALHVTLSGPASLNSPDVCPSVCFSSGCFGTVFEGHDGTRCCAASIRLEHLSVCSRPSAFFDPRRR
jgi:hypothetical protein